MSINYLTDIPTGNHNAMGVIQEIKEPPIVVGETWVEVEKIRVENLPNGLYFINGAITYTAGSTNKSNLFRLVEFGVTQGAVNVQLTDTSEVLYMPFRSFVNVKRHYIEIALEAQQVGGGAVENLEVIGTHIDYEKKSDYHTRDFVPPALLEGDPIGLKRLIHRR